MSDLAFHADLPGLEELVHRIAAYERHCAAVTSELEASVGRLHGEWSGVAAGRHLEAHRRWSEGEQRMRSAVAQLRAVVDAAHGNYSAAMAASARMWG